MVIAFVVLFMALGLLFLATLLYDARSNERFWREEAKEARLLLYKHASHVPIVVTYLEQVRRKQGSES